MDILILSKTHMNGGKCCIGGITRTGQPVRLLTTFEENQPEDTELAPRQIWEIEFTQRKHINPPHVEDVIIQSKKLKSSLKDGIKVVDFIKERKIPIWQGDADALFDKVIKWTNSGSGFINREAIPNNSVGFWISNKDLTRQEFHGVRYNYPSTNGWRSLKFVGYQTPVNKIPAGTLLRVSLARWWDTNGTTEDRCFLQLSGWYDLNETEVS
ncbi:MAG: dual OB domain-containing protein [Bacteroidia bacterium]